MTELGTVGGAYSRVGLSQVVADGDCHTATYDMIEHSQTAAMGSGLQRIPANLDLVWGILVLCLLRVPYSASILNLGAYSISTKRKIGQLSVRHLFRLLRRKLSVLLALIQMLLTWVFHCRSSFSVTPKYLQLGTLLGIHQQSWYK